MEQRSAPQPPPVQANPNIRTVLRSFGEGLINLTGGKKRSGWLPPASWLWGLAPILFAALRVLVVSRGDAETLRALVQNLNVTALVLATVLPFGAVVSVVLTLSLIVSRKARGGQPSPTGEPFLFLVLVAVTGLLVLYAMPVWQIGAAVGAVTMVVIIMFFVRFIGIRAQKTTKNGAPKTPIIILVVVTILTVLFSPIIYLIGWSGMWLPMEHITLADNDITPAYILSSDERWTSYMDEQRRVHLVPTSAITHRDAVGPSGSWKDKSLAENTSNIAGTFSKRLWSICH